MKFFLLIFIATITLGACSPDKAPKIAEPQRQALDKAKAVSNQVNQQAAEQQQLIDETSK